MRPIFRVGVVPTNEKKIKKKFVFDRRWRAVGKGREFFKEGEVRFPKVATQKRDGAYRSMPGPCAAHTGVIYENSNENVRLALRRLTACRLRKVIMFGEEHELLDGGEYHYELLGRQQQFIQEHQPIFRSIFTDYQYVLSKFTTMHRETMLHYADKHPKMRLRIQAYLELVETGQIANKLWLKEVLYKFKRDEIAKVGKFGRMIGDLGVAASLQGFVIMEMLKDAMEKHSIEINGGLIYFCKKPKQSVLSWVFTQLINPSGRFFYVLFSDDSCLSIRINGVVHTFNLDISSCDASHGSSLFNLFENISRETNIAEVMHILVEQCRLRIRVNDLQPTKRRVKLEYPDPRLFSGSTITTAINNLANICIAISVSEADFTLDEPSKVIARAAERAGYVVTCEVCDIYQDIQFLKHSPVYDVNGRLRPLLNIGVLLRMSGTCKGDIPGRKTESLADRAKVLQHRLLQGAYPRVSFPLIDNMKNREVPTLSTRTHCQIDKMVDKLFEYKVDADEHFVVDSVEMWKRYRLSEYDIFEVEEVFGNMQVQEHLASPALGKILKVDYGLQEAEGLSLYTPYRSDY